MICLFRLRKINTFGEKRSSECSSALSLIATAPSRRLFTKTRAKRSYPGDGGASSRLTSESRVTAQKSDKRERHIFRYTFFSEQEIANGQLWDNVTPRRNPDGDRCESTQKLNLHTRRSEATPHLSLRRNIKLHFQICDVRLYNEATKSV